MTQPNTDDKPAVQDVLAQHSAALEDLLRAVEAQQVQLDVLRRRVQELEGVPWPNQEPPDTD
jgi:hypothetical protein